MAALMPVNVEMKTTAAGLTIGAPARRFGLATHVLRHWESMGLLAPGRTAGGQRRYGDPDLMRVAMILMGREAGIGLRDLAEILAVPDPRERADLLRRHVAELADRIARAQAAKDLIEEALSCPLPFDECPRAREQIAVRIPPAEILGLHVEHPDP
jgi:MerR family copper efflux transcriptional regulator